MTAWLQLMLACANTSGFLPNSCMGPSDAAAVGAFIIAAIALWHSIRTERRRSTLEQLVREEKEQERDARQRAHLSGRVERTQRGAKLVLVNERGADARGLRIALSYSKTPNIEPVTDPRIQQRLQVERLPPGGEWIVPLTFFPEVCIPPLVVELTWIDASSEPQQTTLFLSW